MTTTARASLLIAILCAMPGCASFCSLSDTGMFRGRPYSGVRATFTDWEGCSEKPWGNDPHAWHFIPYKLYFRTVDVPLSLVADTLLLPTTAILLDEGAARQASPGTGVEPNAKQTGMRLGD